MFKASSAKQKIDFEEPIWLAGYTFRRLSKGTSNPLYARTLVIKKDTDVLVLTSVDVIGLLKYDIENWKKDWLKDGLPVENIIVCSTHTHSGPDTMGLWSLPIIDSKKKESTLKKIKEACAQSIVQALSTTQIAEFTIINKRLNDFSHNRRVPTENNPKLSVIHFRNHSTKKTISSLISFPSHAVILNRNNNKISSDYPGLICNAIDSKIGGCSIFVPSYLAGIVPKIPKRGSESLNNYSNKLSKAIIELIEAENKYEQEDIKALNEDVSIPIKNMLFNLVYRLGILKGKLNLVDIETKVSSWKFGNFKLLFAPGELSWELSEKVKQSTKSENLIVGLANDQLGYLLSKKEYKEDAYKYERRLCISRSAGEIISSKLIELNNRLN
ncbi:MAG: neutral/alkaline non-lysosomal ceramidase N-terminal domain-containing protein [Candidatus Caenarcaniphilales bacterium]|nr:neutral/alkaline non-lysosomal ceramidase N-terminal domain-containing protein [Candidatus Caenarcaniphilales bacterium]